MAAFSGLPKSVLDANLDTAVATNRAATPAEQRYAVNDNYGILDDSVALGSRLTPAFRAAHPQEVAQVGAVIGEWVGGARGLGALMIQANGRMKTDLMFAALIVVVALSLALYAVIDAGLRRMLARRGF